jgi:hypothetical protein
MLTAERLKQLVSYDPETGLFKNSAPRKKVRVGEVAGSLDKSNGYIKLTIDRRHYFAHRLAFLFVTGAWPSGIVDHINGNRTDNKLANLRQVSRELNQQNMRKASKASASGLLGAFKKRDKWESKIKVHGKAISLGAFDTAEQAHHAYVQAKRLHHAGCIMLAASCWLHHLRGNHATRSTYQNRGTQ